MEKGQKIKEKVKGTVKKVNKENAKKALLSEKMNRRHKYIILGLSSVLIGLCLYLGIVFVLNHTTTVEDTMQEITLEEYIKTSLSKEKQVVYIATKGSKVNAEYEKIVLGALAKRETKVKFLDLGILEERSQLIDFMNVLELTKTSYTEPMLLVFEEEKVKDSLIGAANKATLTQFLDRNRVD